MSGVRCEDGQIHTQVEGVNGIDLPKIAKREDATHIMHCTMIQLSLGKGLKWFGKEGEKTAVKKMKHHHDMSTLKPKFAHKLSFEVKRNIRYFHC